MADCSVKSVKNFLLHVSACSLLIECTLALASLLLFYKSFNYFQLKMKSILFCVVLAATHLRVQSFSLVTGTDLWNFRLESLNGEFQIQKESLSAAYWKDSNGVRILLKGKLFNPGDAVSFIAVGEGEKMKGFFEIHSTGDPPYLVVNTTLHSDKPGSIIIHTDNKTEDLFDCDKRVEIARSENPTIVITCKKKM